MSNAAKHREPISASYSHISGVISVMNRGPSGGDGLSTTRSLMSAVSDPSEFSSWNESIFVSYVSDMFLRNVIMNKTQIFQLTSSKVSVEIIHNLHDF